MKEVLWLSCREKRCCHDTRVIIGGRDLWRIAGALELAPWEFTVYGEAHPGAADGFRLAPGGQRFQLLLAKRGAGAKAPCFFLWKLGDGHAQCGLGALRPMACQSYPSLLLGGLLCVESAACTCRRWSLVDVDEGAERALLDRQLGEAAEYSALVADWNERIIARGPSDFPTFCGYLLDHYAGGAA
jgi:hypothetical protein